MVHFILILLLHVNLHVLHNLPASTEFANLVNFHVCIAKSILITVPRVKIISLTQLQVNARRIALKELFPMKLQKSVKFVQLIA